MPSWVNTGPVLLAHLAAALDKDAPELQAGLAAGELPPWVGHRSPIDP